MTWVMRLPGGTTASSDDFTLEDLMRIEEETGEPWSVGNPLRTVKTARAFLKTAYRRNGLAWADADSLTLGGLKHVFAFEPDEPWPGDGEDGEDDDGPLDLKGRASSPGAPAASTGGRAKPAKSA